MNLVGCPKAGPGHTEPILFPQAGLAGLDKLESPRSLGQSTSPFSSPPCFNFCLFWEAFVQHVVSDQHLDITGALVGAAPLGVWGCGGRILPGEWVQEQSVLHWGVVLVPVPSLPGGRAGWVALRASWGEGGIWLCWHGLTGSQCKLLGWSWSNCCSHSLPAMKTPLFQPGTAAAWLSQQQRLKVSFLVPFRSSTDHGEGRG